MPLRTYSLSLSREVYPVLRGVFGDLRLVDGEVKARYSWLRQLMSCSDGGGCVVGS